MDKAYEMPHFVYQELVPPVMDKRFGSNAIRYIDIRTIANLNAIRKWLNSPMTVNNWHTGGDRVASGIRLPGMKHYSMFSGHSFGMAIDAVGSGIEQAKRAILEGGLVLPHSCRIELNVNWLHMDVMNCTNTNVITFKAS